MYLPYQIHLLDCYNLVDHYYHLIDVHKEKPGIKELSSERDFTNATKVGLNIKYLLSQDIVLDAAFNPDYVRVTAPVPQLRTRPDSLRFLVEFYDVNNNIADSIIFSDAQSFTGENTSIGGTDNILSGSMVIGSALGSGIEMAGVGSGFVRSIGYKGFTSGSAGTGGPGFMMWSGSVADSIDSSEAYQGVGLEIVDAHGANDRYLQFKTNPSIFKVQTDEFFLGLSTSTFVIDQTKDDFINNMPIDFPIDLALLQSLDIVLPYAGTLGVIIYQGSKLFIHMKKLRTEEKQESTQLKQWIDTVCKEDGMILPIELPKSSKKKN